MAKKRKTNKPIRPRKPKRKISNKKVEIKSLTRASKSPAASNEVSGSLAIVASSDKTAQISHETAENLIKILELIVNDDGTKFDLYKRLTPLHEHGIKVQRKKDIIYSLHSCMVSKRYLMAAKLLELLAVEKNGKDHIFFHGALKVLENSPIISQDQIRLFFRNVFTLTRLNKKEVVLEYMMFKMRHGDFEPPTDLIQKVRAQRNTFRKSQPIDASFLAYCSIYEYISWVKFRSSTNLDEHNVGVKLKEKFISNISEVISQEGVWDVFVIKVREMLEYYNELDECEEMLETYLYSNLDHLHAHFYMYDFLKKHNRESEKQRKALQEIVNLSPSDILALDYASLLIEENNHTEAARILFEFLEYPNNKENVTAWEMMKNIGVEALDNSDVLKMMKTNWKKRRSYWPYYHFDQHTADVDSKERGKCVVHKCAFLSIVANSKDDLSYIETIKTLLEIERPKRLRSLNKILKHIENLQSRD